MAVHGAARPAGGTRLVAWRPPLDRITEVLHARFTDHAYPLHTHDAWTLLIVDDGVIRYDIDRREQGVVRPTVTLLPPDVPHDGRAATSHGFRKRVAYLDRSVLGKDLIGRAVDRPSLPDPALRQQVDRLHVALHHPVDTFEAESRLELIRERLEQHLRGRSPAGSDPPVAGLPARLRELLDAELVNGVTLHAAAETLNAHPAHLVRAFTRQYGLPPHRYLTGRRVDLARQLLLAGRPAAEVAVAVGFYDQAHLTRHFRRYLGVPPANYRRRATDR
ncbi:MAG TPA: AraC family transcriptional regulator [Jiangellaceae bacterium]|nr:AraC family transcriptional regulator [Jiangellaceae bacterium]